VSRRDFGQNAGATLERFGAALDDCLLRVGLLTLNRSAQSDRVARINYPRVIAELRQRSEFAALAEQSSE
jgi:hypothetical protein